MEVGAIFNSPARVSSVSRYVSEGGTIASAKSVDRYVNVPAANSDSVEISTEAKKKYEITIKMPGSETSEMNEGSETESAEKNENSSNDSKKINQDKSKNTQTTSADTTELSDEQKQAIADLKARDSEVRAHEQAHISASGGLARGGASFSYQTGPDGQKYAVGGEVQIDISADSDPQQTIIKMAQVRRAALAPADPSAQDRAIANQASQVASLARSEINSGIVSSFTQESGSGTSSDGKSSGSTSAQALQSDSSSSYEDTTSRIINAMGGTGSLTVLKSDDSDDAILSRNLAKAYSQYSSKESTILKSLA